MKTNMTYRMTLPDGMVVEERTSRTITHGIACRMNEGWILFATTSVRNPETARAKVAVQFGLPAVLVVAVPVV